MDNLNNIISSIMKGLPSLSFQEIETNSEYKRSFYIEELNKQFTLEHTILETLGKTSEQASKIERYFLKMYKYVFTMGNANFASEKRTNEEFSQYIIDYLASQYKKYQFENSNEYSDFLKRVQQASGHEIREWENDGVVREKYSKKINIGEHMLLIFLVPEMTSYTIFNFAVQKPSETITEFETQEELLNYLEHFKNP